MKHKHIFSLLDNTFTTVRVTYDNDAAAVTKPKTLRAQQAPSAPPMPAWGDPADDGAFATGATYVYKIPRAWMPRVGQQAIALVHGRMTVVTIMQVDETPDIDIDAAYDYKWLVQLIHTTEFEELVEREKAFGAAMLEVERTKKREELVNSFRNTLEPGSAALKLFEQTAASLTVDKPAPVTPPSAPSAPTHGMRNPFPGEPAGDK